MGVATRRILLALLVAFWLPLLFGGCSGKIAAPVYGWNWQGPTPAGFYLVRDGDSLGTVAQRLGISTRKLVTWNGLKRPYTIYADTLLRVEPPDSSGAKPKPEQPARTAAAPSRKRETAARPHHDTDPQSVAPTTKTADQDAPGRRREQSGIVWEWPLNGRLIQGFKASDRARQGIRISGRAGEQVSACADGQVVYSGGGLKSYGNLIIIKHNDNYLSAYGFSRSLFVQEGDRVKRGQAVAEVGQSAEGTHLLHFEVRRHGTAVDPLAYLPPRH